MALATDASYKKIVTTNDMAIFSYIREKAGHKVLVILNLSNQPQRFTIKDKSVLGQALNVFGKNKVGLTSHHVYSLAPWDYEVYEY